ncbi:MAG: nitroreductase [Pseudomonadota bacterium]
MSEALQRRISTRAFLSTPVPRATIDDILKTARRAPSGGNLQPWRVDVVTGDARQLVIDAVEKRLAEDPFGHESDFLVYPPKLHEPYRTRRYELGEEMYALLGVPREDKPARLAHLARNFRFFDAPVGMFFSLDTRFDKPQWAHLGMFMMSIALLAEERGLATCFQEAWAAKAKTVAGVLGTPDDMEIYCGMALGFADTEAPVNRLTSTRASVEDFTAFRGFPEEG